MKRVNPKIASEMGWLVPTIGLSIYALVHFIIISKMESREEHILSITDQISKRIYE